MPEGLSSFQRRNETHQTYRLKWAAWEWLYNIAQCRCIGMEVRLQGPGGRVVDLVGVGPENTIYIVEVKASLPDFSRDDHTPEGLVALRAQARALANRINLAQETLSQAIAYARKVQPETWEETRAYRQALDDCQRLDREKATYQTRLAAYSIKFHDGRFLAIANYHYIMAPRGEISRRRVPPQWGLLDETPSVVIPAPPKDIRKTTGIVSNILRAIARSNTTAMMRSLGVSFTEEGAVFPRDSAGAVLTPDLSSNGRGKLSQRRGRGQGVVDTHPIVD
jgi:hypothetical protein